MTLILERAAIGFVLAALISIAARRLGALSISGAIASTAAGLAAVIAGWNWGALLVIYFATSSALSHYRAARKATLTGDIVAKGGARDATQVAANGGIFVASALLSIVDSHRLAPMLTFAALGALAASAADTWATEFGTLFGGVPRSAISWRQVPPGTSGGVSLAGSLAMVAGALFVAVSAWALQLSGSVVIVAAAGVAGACADSLLGGTLQERRWCAACERHTERRVHGCGTVTSMVGGFAWLDNDVVNLIATIVGAAVASLLAAL